MTSGTYVQIGGCLETVGAGDASQLAGDRLHPGERTS